MLLRKQYTDLPVKATMRRLKGHVDALVDGTGLMSCHLVAALNPRAVSDLLR
jgi:hypothetical protein